MGPLSTEAARPLHRPPPPFDDRGIGLSICIVHFHCAGGFRQNPLTCIHVRLLGPCFKTGQSFHRPTRRGKADRNSKGCLLYKSATCLSGLKARTPGADAGAKTSSRAFGPSPTVPVVKPPEDAPADRAGTQRPVIADPTTRAARALRLGPEGKLRGKLRLLPYSFTYS